MREGLIQRCLGLVTLWMLLAAALAWMDGFIQKPQNGAAVQGGEAPSPALFVFFGRPSGHPNR